MVVDNAFLNGLDNSQYSNNNDSKIYVSMDKVWTWPAA